MTADNGQLIRLYNNHELEKKHRITRTLVIDIFKSKEKIRKAVKDGYGPNQKRLKGEYTCISKIEIFRDFRFFKIFSNHSKNA